MTDAALLDAFAGASLTPDRFGHAEHVRLSWLQVTRMPLLEAIRQHCDGLRRLTRVLGVPDKFHATITVAWLLLIADRAARCGASTFADFAAANSDLLRSSGAPLAEHYTPACLRSAAARAHFVQPDVEPSPA